MADSDNLITVRDMVGAVEEQLKKADVTYGHGTNTSLDEAVSLICYCLGLASETFEEFLDTSVKVSDKNIIFRMLDHRIHQRKPLPYLTNEAWLCDYKFFVDERSIIPRSYIAELITQSFKPWITEPSRITNILDLCTGSGCLAIIAADIFQNAIVDASDSSGEALEVAKINIEKFKLGNRINLYQGDLFTSLPKPKEYDLIICNPPYVSEETMKTLPLEYKSEPALALFSEHNGLWHIKQIINSSKTYLSKMGILVLEVGSAYKKFENHFSDLSYTWLTTSTSDKSTILISADELNTTKPLG